VGQQNHCGTAWNNIKEPYPNPVGQIKNCILKDKDTLSDFLGALTNSVQGNHQNCILKIKQILYWVYRGTAGNGIVVKTRSL